MPVILSSNKTVPNTREPTSQLREVFAWNGDVPEEARILSNCASRREGNSSNTAWGELATGITQPASTALRTSRASIGCVFVWSSGRPVLDVGAVTAHLAVPPSHHGAVALDHREGRVGALDLLEWLGARDPSSSNWKKGSRAHVKQLMKGGLGS